MCVPGGIYSSEFLMMSLWKDHYSCLLACLPTPHREKDNRSQDRRKNLCGLAVDGVANLAMINSLIPVRDNVKAKGTLHQLSQSWVGILIT